MRQKSTVISLLAILALLLFIFHLTFSSAAGSGAFYLDPTVQAHNSLCTSVPQLSLDYNDAPLASTKAPIVPSASESYCSSPNSALCPDCPYDGPTTGLSSVTLNLYGINGSGDFFTVTIYDANNGNMIAVTPDYLYVSGFSSSTCSEQSFTIPLATGGDSQNAIYNGHSISVFIFFPNGSPNTGNPATICYGGSTASNLVFNPSLPTPEFPLGSILAILVPLFAVALYMIIGARRQRRNMTFF